MIIEIIFNVAAATLMAEVISSLRRLAGLSESFANLDLNWKTKVTTSQYQIPQNRRILRLS